MGPGNGPADRIGSPVHFLGGQVRAAEGLGEPVHQEQPGRRLSMPQRAHRLGRQPPACVGEHSQVGQRRLPEFAHVQQPQPQGRHGREDGHFIRAQPLDDLPRERRSLHHERRRCRHRAQQLAHAVDETEGQQARDAVVSRDLEVGDHGAGAREEIRVGDGHALRHAGRTGRVNNLNHVVTDSGHGGERRVAVRSDRPHIHHADVGAQRPGLACKHFVARDQDTGAGVREQVLDLTRPERFVHENGDRADGQCCEERGGRVATTFQHDRHRIVRCHPGREQRRGDRRYALEQRRIGRALLALDHGRSGAMTLGCVPQERCDVVGCGVARPDCRRQEITLPWVTSVSRLCNEHTTQSRAH